MEFRLTPKYHSNQTFLQKAAAKGSGNANETAVFTRLWGPGRGHRGRSNGIGLEGKGRVGWKEQRVRVHLNYSQGFQGKCQLLGRVARPSTARS